MEFVDPTVKQARCPLCHRLPDVCFQVECGLDFWVIGCPNDLPGAARQASYESATCQWNEIVRTIAEAKPTLDPAEVARVLAL